jgi:hypothetical protein
MMNIFLIIIKTCQFLLVIFWNKYLFVSLFIYVAQKNIFFNVSLSCAEPLAKAISGRKNSATILTSRHEPYPRKIEPLRVLMTHEDIKTNLPILKIVKYY